jgi:dienelactone hydrolase
VKTPDGTCDAVVFHPATKGKWPAVLIWPDIMGLRPAFRDMGRRLAAQGYTVLVVNPFYRSAHAPVIGDNFDFSNPESRARLMGYRAAMTNEGVDRDAVAYLAFLDTLPRARSACRAIAWAGRCRSALPRLQIASGRSAASMAATAWSPTSPTARIC